VGVYYDDNGKVPLLSCVQKAEEMIAAPAPRTYLPIEGLAAYDKAVQELVFGADSAVVQENVRSPCKPSAAPAH
jgi:aromatic-amino-acid transaminase